MVTLTSLWLSILLSAVLVFVVSSIVHMVLKYHQNDFRRFPDEEAVRRALGPLNIPAGDYALPYAGSMEAMKSPEYAAKLNEGPVLHATVMPNGPFAMGAQLGQWFLFSVLVSVFAGYIASRTLPVGTDYLTVFRITGTVAFAGYALGDMPQSIWYKRGWGATFRSMFDGLLYALVTAGVFGWRWPSM
ncbi:MAG: hypothetical protein ABR551_14440 [Gemmatimonadales bacterium]